MTFYIAQIIIVKKKCIKPVCVGGAWGGGGVVIDINVDFLFKQVIMEQYF